MLRLLVLGFDNFFSFNSWEGKSQNNEIFGSKNPAFLRGFGLREMEDFHPQVKGYQILKFSVNKGPRTETIFIYFICHSIVISRYQDYEGGKWNRRIEILPDPHPVISMLF